MITSTLFSRNQALTIALLGYFGLLVSLAFWIITTKSANPDFPASSTAFIALTPLLFPLRGLLAGKPYTHYWTGFLMLFYFMHGVGEAYVNPSHLFAWLEIIFSVILFIFSLVYIRRNAQK